MTARLANYIFNADEDVTNGLQEIDRLSKTLSIRTNDEDERERYKRDFAKIKARLKSALFELDCAKDDLLNCEVREDVCKQFGLPLTREGRIVNPNERKH